MSFEFKKCFLNDSTEFKGLYEICPKVFGDSRGYIFEAWTERDFLEAGLNVKFVQDNVSKSCKGVLRGMHFQKNHPQGKLVCPLVGRVYDVAVDLRRGSATFGKYYGVILDAEKQNMFYIPEGFAHGFYVLSEEAEFCYKCTDLYHPGDEGGIRWDDPDLAIAWPLLEELPVILSSKDAQLPRFQELKKT